MTFFSYIYTKVVSQQPRDREQARRKDENAFFSPY
jgi:hypothetical protein